MATLQFQVDAIRQAVTSSTTCTPATTASLKTLLLPRDPVDSSAPRHAPTDKATRPAPPSRPATAASSRPGTATARRRAVTSRDNGPRQDNSACLSDKEKAQLATHVVNAALKALAEAAKPAPVPCPPAQPLGDDNDAAVVPPAKSAARKGLRRSTSMPITPLQPRTMNRVCTSPIKPTDKSSATAANTNNRAACAATVECARLAFGALRTLQDSGSVVLPDTQLEAGLSSFVAKLIGLNMTEQASRELCMLKRRLQRLASLHAAPVPGTDAKATKPADAPSKQTTKAAKPSRSTATTTTSTQVSKGPLSAPTGDLSSTSAEDLLDYGDVSTATGPVLKLIVASQLQALRILVALKKPMLTEAALAFLRQNCSSSPLNLLVSAFTSSEGSAAEQQKTARQLETLGQLLLALTPSISTKDDATILESKLSIEPAVALELQCLSLQVRVQCWTFARGSESGRTAADVDKDILTPFSRCLSAYARRCRSAKKSPSYSFCRNQFDVIRKLLQASSFASTRTSKSPIASIYQTLSSIARETGRLDDAIFWATQLTGLLNQANDSPSRCCSTSAHLLALQLRNAATQGISQDIQTRLAEVLEAIKGPLKGDTAELEELLGNVCLVRKAAVSLLVSQTNGACQPQDEAAAKLSEPSRLLLEAFALQCPRFCLRWLGKPPAAKSSTKDFLRYEQRRQLLSQSIRHTLDSALVVIKNMIGEGRLAWEQIDSILSDSVTVLDYLGDLRVTDAAASYYVKISHFYYLSHTSLRRRGDTSNSARDALKALHRSIDCVKHRPGPEKEKAQLVTKLERLAELSKSAGQIGDALGALQAIRTSLVDDGALAQVAAALNAQPPSLAWKASEKVESLSRTLISICRLEQVHMDWTVVLDELERAAVLEHELHFIHLGRSGSPKSTQEHSDLDLTHPCVEALLRVYYPTRFPIRRIRTLLCLFSANLDRSNILADIAPQTSAALGLIETQGLADDSCLAAYLQHYQTLATSLTAFAEGYPDTGVLHGCLSTWQALVAANPTLPALERVVDNAIGLWTHLQSIAEFLKAMGRDALVTTVLELSSALAQALSASEPANEERGLVPKPLVHDSALALSSHYIRLGDCLKAERVLEHLQAEIQLSSGGVSDSVSRFHLSFAEYLIATGQFEEASQHLLKANPISDEDVLQKRRGTNGLRKRLLCAQACLLYSIVALEKGDYHVSLQNARNGVRMLFQDWNRLEKTMQSARHGSSTSEDGSPETTTLEQSNTDLAASLQETGDDASSLLSPDALLDSVSKSPKAAASPEFWTLFHPLFDSMMRLSSVYAHLGLFQETVYYAEQAQKIAAATNTPLSMAQVEAWQGTVWLKAGKLDKALVYASHVRSRMVGLEQSSRKAMLACELIDLYRKSKDDAGERDMLQQAEDIIQCISESEPGRGATKEDALLAKDEAGPAPAPRRARATTARAKPAATTSAARTTRTAKTTATRVTATKGTKAANATKKASPSTTAVVVSSSAAIDASTLLPADNAAILGLRAAVLSHKVMSHVDRKEWAAALTLLRDNSASSTAVPPVQAATRQLADRVALAACLLGYSTDQMAHDAVFSVLQDSTLSFPAVSSSSNVCGSAVDSRLSGPKSPVATKGRIAVRVLENASKASVGFVDMLQEAQDCLIEAQTLAAISGDTGTLNRISSMLQSAVLVLSATSWSKPRVLSHPAYASCSVELARNMTWRRERRAVLVEKASLVKGDGALEGLWWPTSTGVTVPSPAANNKLLSDTPRRASMGAGSLGGPMDPVCIRQFQRDYIDIVPKDWSVISLALSDNKHDLCITKLQAGHSPFVIRLPLERATSRDADNEVFNFQQGRAELLDIVQAINGSCHDARDMTVKGAKTAWWTEREMLDTRLKELLDNIEQIWLGGFRGIFSQHVRRTAFFARFQKAFETMLDKHLPSRRAPAGRGKRKAAAGKMTGKAAAAVPRVSLDARVLDLFIGLGDATAEQCDFDEALDDLLYFVVDILQFHGEHNAYDEIDFDSMVVETTDALFAYHSGVRESGARESSADHLHTILVLDKSLHVFPWESLPCMQGLAVSRVPSLACLRRLIIDQQKLQQEQEQDGTAVAMDRPSGHRASPANGTYVLNPSGDLGSTQTAFEGLLATEVRGPAWTRIVGRAPTEDEFEAALRSKDVLLYFGHGSGAQYIRGRTVRKLERCRATALLMGCGSAMLDYNGEFELHGPVWNYMLAGSPAVVGTLWDVTDKDIDRFAGRTFEEWGLMARGAFAGDAATKQQQQQQRRQQHRPAEAAVPATMSLVEAVVQAREAPRFRYITAAAVCVYGIPVYLS